MWPLGVPTVQQMSYRMCSKWESEEWDVLTKQRSSTARDRISTRTAWTTTPQLRTARPSWRCDGLNRRGKFEEACVGEADKGHNARASNSAQHGSYQAQVSGRPGG